MDIYIERERGREEEGVEYPIGQDRSSRVDEVAPNSVSPPPVGLDHQFRQWDLLVRLR